MDIVIKWKFALKMFCRNIFFHFIGNNGLSTLTQAHNVCTSIFSVKNIFCGLGKGFIDFYCYFGWGGGQNLIFAYFGAKNEYFAKKLHNFFKFFSGLLSDFKTFRTIFEHFCTFQGHFQTSENGNLRRKNVLSVYRIAVYGASLYLEGTPTSREKNFFLNFFRTFFL